MFEQLKLGVGGLGGVGSGIGGYKSWIVAFVILFVLAWLGWWTMRPARRAVRSQRRDGPRRTDPAKLTGEHVGDDHVTPAKQTRKAR